MKKLLILILVLAIPATVMATGVGRTPVTICHATRSETNPYVQITVDDDAVDGVGNSDHNRGGHQDGQDIIPPGSWDPDGRNWFDANIAIYENGCKPVEPPIERCPFDESLPATHPNCVEPPEEEPPEEPELPPVDDETEVRSKVKVDMSTVLEGK